VKLKYQAFYVLIQYQGAADIREVKCNLRGKPMKLRVIQGATPGRVFEIVDGLNLLGRECNAGDSNIIDLEGEDLEEKMSRQHAVIQKQGETAIIWDLGSLNGTFVNRGDRLKEGDKLPLQNGDKLILGKTAFVFEV